MELAAFAGDEMLDQGCPHPDRARPRGRAARRRVGGDHSADVVRRAAICPARPCAVALCPTTRFALAPTISRPSERANLHSKAGRRWLVPRPDVPAVGGELLVERGPSRRAAGGCRGASELRRPRRRKLRGAAPPPNHRPIPQPAQARGHRPRSWPERSGGSVEGRAQQGGVGGRGTSACGSAPPAWSRCSRSSRPAGRDQAGEKRAGEQAVADRAQQHRAAEARAAASSSQRQPVGPGAGPRQARKPRRRRRPCLPDAHAPLGREVQRVVGRDR